MPMWKLYLFWKLHMFNERVTSLESHALCSWKFKHVPFDGSNIKTFMSTNVWDIVHLSHQYPELAMEMCDIFFDQTLPSITGERNNIAKEQVHNIIKLATKWIDEFKENIKYFEVKNTMVINGMIVTWSYDCLLLDNDWELHLFDYKTTNNIDFYKNWIEKKQIMIYAYMVMKKMQLDKLKVSYQIYVKWKDNTKAKAVRKTKVLYMNTCWLLNQIDYIDDIETKVFKIIDDYKWSKERDLYRPKPVNEDGSKLSSCRYCPMRDGESAAKAWLSICPAAADWATLDIDQEILFED